MKYFHHARRSFVRQLTQNDCGIACIAMVLRYIGRSDEAYKLRQNSLIPENGFSLLELRNLAKDQNLSAQCVRMELEFLRNNSSPCILHLVNANGNSHFQVCYGAKRGIRGHSYLMADPTRHVYYLDEDKLEEQWVGKAALYFGELPAAKHSGIKAGWGLLSLLKLFPRGLLIIIPLLNICTMFLGVALSWVLQRGFNDSLVGKKESLVVAIVLLLLIITLSKGLFSYIRQRLLINLDNMMNKHLVSHFISNVMGCRGYYMTGHNLPLVKKGFLEIRKVQNAITGFLATLLSGGSLVLLMLSGITYYLSYAGIINMIYLIALASITITRLPGLLFDYSNLNELSGITENTIIKYLGVQKEAAGDDQDRNRFQFHIGNHAGYLNAAAIVAGKINKMNLIYDWLGTVNVILVFVCGIFKLYLQTMDYSSFAITVILSYFITNLMPGICSSLYTITEGIDALQQYDAWLPKQ